MQIPEKKTTVERRSLILKTLESKGQVSVNELSNTFGVSEVTIRNDLSQLEEKNMLLRARGGAIKLETVGFDFELSDKDKIHLKEKQKIGQKASAFVHDGDTIIIDSGTTSMELARNLMQIGDLTVITNALNIATQLTKNKNINTIIPGGFLRKQSMSLIGAPAERGFKNYYCDKLFLGVDGLDIDFGLSTPNVEEAHLNQTMIDISKQVILLADSSKFLRRSLAFICPVSSIDVLITDNGIHPDTKRKFEHAGVEVVIA